MTALQFFTNPRLDGFPIIAYADAHRLTKVIGGYDGHLIAEPHEFEEMADDPELELVGAILGADDVVRGVFWLRSIA